MIFFKNINDKDKGGGGLLYHIYQIKKGQGQQRKNIVEIAALELNNSADIDLLNEKKCF